MALATSSLPVPLSPWISTVLETGAICSILTSTSWIGALSPMMPVRSCSSAALDQPPRGGHRVVGRHRLHHRLGDAEPADPLGPLGVGGLEQGEGARSPRRAPGRRAGGRAARAPPPVRMTSSGFSRRTVPRASSSEENIAVEKPAASNAALRRTAVSRSSMVMRIARPWGETNATGGQSQVEGRSKACGLTSAPVFAPHQFHRVLHQVLEHREPVAHAAGAAGEVHDQGAAADAGEAARERRAGEAGIGRSSGAPRRSRAPPCRARRGWPRG